MLALHGAKILLVFSPALLFADTHVGATTTFYDVPPLELYVKIWGKSFDVEKIFAIF